MPSLGPLETTEVRLEVEGVVEAWLMSALITWKKVRVLEGQLSLLEASDASAAVRFVLDCLTIWAPEAQCNPCSQPRH